jgi:hypothetical protein
MGIAVVNLRGARATHFTGYCCWFDVGLGKTPYWILLLVYMWGLGQHNLLGIVVGLCASRKTLLGNTLLGIAVGLCGPRATHFTWHCCLLCCASENTLYWLLLLVYDGPRTTHFTGCCCGLCEVLGNTPYWASLCLMWGAFINGFKIILFSSPLVS